MWVQATTTLAETTALADFRGLTVFSAIPVVDCNGSRAHELNDKAGNLSCPKIHAATWTYILLARGKVIDFLGFKKNVALFGNWRDGGKVRIVKLVW